MASSLSGGIIPGLQPPPGVTSNFVNPYNQSKYTVTMVATLLAVATAVVWIRMYTKICLIKSHGWDDCKLLAFQDEKLRCTDVIQTLPSLPGCACFRYTSLIRTSAETCRAC